MVYDNLYILDIVAKYHESLNIESCRTKRKLDNAHSVALLHKRLSYISRNRVERLVSDETLMSVLSALNSNRRNKRNLVHIELQCLRTDT